MLVRLSVPEEHYLEAVQWLARRTMSPAAALHDTNEQLSAVVDQLQAQLEKEHQENWVLRERIKLDAERTGPSETMLENLRIARRQANAEADALREELVRMGRAPVEVEEISLAAHGLLDSDDSYPDHGEADDRAAAIGEPSLTAGTMTEEQLAEDVRRAARADAAESVAEDGRHEAAEPPQDEPAAAPEGEGPEEPEHGAHEAPEPVAPTNERDAAIDMFIEDMVVKAAPDTVITTQDVAAAYDEWRPTLGAPAAGVRQLGKRLAARGVTIRRASNRDAALLGSPTRSTMYVGIAIKGRPARTLPEPAGQSRPSRRDLPGRELPAEIRDIAKEVLAVHPDWVYKRANGNRRGKPRLITPTGKRIILPNTPSDSRAAANTLAHLRRMGAKV